MTQKFEKYVSVSKTALSIVHVSSQPTAVKQLLWWFL